MDTRLLRTFVAVYETGSFTAAGQALAFAQSTVSAHVQALEKRLGVRLFERLPTHAVPTADGRRLLPLARQLLALAAKLERTAAADDARVVRLLAPDTLCGHRIPAAVALLRQRRPGLQLHLAAAGTNAALKGLADGSADLALVFESELPDAGYRRERIGAEPLDVICPPDHPLAGRRAGWSHLAEHPFLLLEEGCTYSDAVARRITMAAGGRATLSHFGSAEAVRACVGAGLGLSVLPRVAVADALRAGRLATVAAAGLPVPRVLLIGRTEQDDDPTVDSVSGALRAVFRPTVSGRAGTAGAGG